MTVAIVHPDGRLVLNGRVYRAALGRGGVRANKQEDDGATPAGKLMLRRLFYRADRGAIPACIVPREPISPEDAWCDDPTHQDYNRHIRLPHVARHESLWRDDALYDIVGVLGWNDAPIERGRGSAIFIHLARPDFAPTDGCIALPLAELRAILASGVSAFDVAQG